MKLIESEQHILESIFLDFVTIINEIRTIPKVSREFSAFCKDCLADHDTFILHTEVRFLSRGKVLERFIYLKDTIDDFLVEWESLSAKLFKDLNWFSGILYFSSIFKELTKLNFSIQGKSGDIFPLMAKKLP